MHRFICRPQDISNQEIRICDKNELHHIKNVLRLKNKAEVIVLDGCGNEFTCRIAQLDNKCAKLDIVKKYSHQKNENNFSITIACALPKKSKMDFIVEKLTEIGVDRIILLKTERTEVVLNDTKKKIAHLKKTAESALKQSGNLFIPEIGYSDFYGLLKIKKDNNFDLAIIPNLYAQAKSIKEALSDFFGKNILIVIGPEGDFSPKEIELAKQNGFVSVSLGKTVLRVDTAAIVTAAFIKFFLNP